jgi:peptidoglycan/LPS O-acetylase OafA/YrhL
MLLAILCVRASVEGKQPRLDALITHLTFTQNLPRYWSIGDAPFGGCALQTWSLAIEEQFYLVWPVIVVLAGRSSIRRLAFWLLFNSVVTRMVGLHPVATLARCDGLALGAILATILDVSGDPFPRRPWLRPALTLVSTVALAFLVSGQASWFEAPIDGLSGCGWLSILAVNLAYFGLIGLVISHSGHPLLAPLRIIPLRYLGRISYGIFLYHLVVIDAVADLFAGHSIATDLIAVAFTILAAVFSWHGLEQPVANLKTRFPYG